MIETYFGLSRRPFLAVPDVHSYFPSETIDAARTNVLRCLNRGEGISLIIGPGGVGKTLLLRLLGLPFQLDYAVVNISNHRLKTPKAFLQQVLFELQQPFCGSEENELRLLLWDHLRRSSFPGVILLVDEGQTLSLSVLEEIRLMLNCDNGMFSRFRIAIAGTLELEERLTHPKLKAFNQWIVSRSYLEPLTRAETSEYILWQTQNARETEPTQAESSAKPVRWTESKSAREFRVDPPHHHSDQFPLFDDFARAKIHELTGGVPRLINQLCDHALVLACETNRDKTIDEPLVRSAWARLQQIPEQELINPLAAPTASSTENVIEFGTLDDDPPNEQNPHDSREPSPPFFPDGEENPAVLFADSSDETDTDLISEEEIELLVEEPEQSDDYRPVPEIPDDHVYQAKSFYESAYPHGLKKPMQNWTGPGHQVECGFATPYREILYRDLLLQSQDAANTAAVVALPPGMVVHETKMDDSRSSLPGFRPEETPNHPPTDFSEPEHHDPEETAPIPTASHIPTPLFKPESAPVIRLHLGNEPDSGPVFLEANRRKAKTLHETFEEEIPVPRSFAPGKMNAPPNGPEGRSRVMVKTSGTETDTLSDHLLEELDLLQQSLTQGVAVHAAERVASLLEDTAVAGSAENVTRSRTLRFDPDVSNVSGGSILSKPKFLARPAVACEELVSIDFRQESRAVHDDEPRQREPQAIWLHSEPKPRERPPLKLKKPVEDTDDPFAESAEDSNATLAEKAFDFRSLFSKLSG